MRWFARTGVVWALALAGCAPSLTDAADTTAQREMPCAIPGRRVLPVGKLVVAPRAPLEVTLYEASGCEQERLYLCIASEHPRCESDIARLPQPGSHAALTRALHLLRTTSRARCPAADLTVTQESESLFRFHACDGTWLYHCRARGCERL
jgi:hypothetical protein